MCTVIKQGQKPLIAENDIEVYKVGEGRSNNDCFYAAIRYFIYIVNNVDHAELVIVDDYPERVEDGIVPSDMWEHEYCNRLFNRKIPYSFVTVGFHSFESLDRTKINSRHHPAFNFKVGLFIIPKGSKYYQNEAGNIVSDTIIFKQIINI